MTCDEKFSPHGVIDDRLPEDRHARLHYMPEILPFRPGLRPLHRADLWLRRLFDRARGKGMQGIGNGPGAGAAGALFDTEIVPAQIRAMIRMPNIGVVKR